MKQTISNNTRTLFRWFREFYHEKSDFKDDGGYERPSTAFSYVNVEKLQVKLKDNPHISYQSIQHTVDSGSAEIF